MTAAATRSHLNSLVLLTVATAALAGGCAQRSDTFLRGIGPTTCSSTPDLDRPLVVANYNIKSGLWTSLDEVAEVLESMDADIIALQEVDNGMHRSGGVDQSEALAERLHAERVFAGAWEKDGGTYGVALLSRVPLLHAERFELPDANNLEPRVAIDATVCAGGTPLHVVTAHSDVLPWSSAAHARALSQRVAGQKDVIVLGDLNTTPTNDSLRGFWENGFIDALAKLAEGPTFGKSLRLDYIFTDRQVDSARIIDSDASDHRPIMATLPMSLVGG